MTTMTTMTRPAQDRVVLLWVRAVPARASAPLGLSERDTWSDTAW